MQSAPERKKNLYLCDTCGQGFISQDLDDGTAPFMTPCLSCKGTAHSLMYAAPQAMLAEFPPAVVWYRPGPEELAKMKPAMQVHVHGGGLVRRDVNHVQGGAARKPERKRIFKP